MPEQSAAALNRAWARWQGSFGTFMARLDRVSVPYLSHSRVSLFERCELCYYRRYVLGEDDETAAMRLGSLFHEAARRLYSTRGSSGAPQLLRRLKTRGLDVERQVKLYNAVALLVQHRWSAHEPVSVEEPFFLELAPAMPPVVGVADLILRDAAGIVVVDHKTSGKFNDHPADQLVLYAEHARRRFGVDQVRGFYDEYRLVSNLATIRTPAFRRTRVPVGRSLLARLASRYRSAWRRMTILEQAGEPAPADDCWQCRSSFR